MNTLLQSSCPAYPARPPLHRLRTSLAAGLAAGLAAAALSGCAGGNSSRATPGELPGSAATNSAASTAGSTAGSAAGNTAGNATAGNGSAAHLYVDRDYGFGITVPPGVQERDTFSPGVLDSGQWEYGASTPTAGSARVALVLPGSNNITTGELRVGVATAPNSVGLCTRIPDGAQKQPQKVTLDRVGFTNFRQQDAAMNHFMRADSYRAIHKNRCYAIDLLVYGTNPQVYDPPATAPFSQDDAMRQLRNMLPGFRFLR